MLIENKSPVSDNTLAAQLVKLISDSSDGVAELSLLDLNGSLRTVFGLPALRAAGLDYQEISLAAVLNDEPLDISGWLVLSQLGNLADPIETLQLLSRYTQSHDLAGLLLVVPNLSHQDIITSLAAGGKLTDPLALRHYFSRAGLLQLAETGGWRLAASADLQGQTSPQHNPDLLLHEATLAGDAIRLITSQFQSDAQVEYFVWQLAPLLVSDTEDDQFDRLPLAVDELEPLDDEQASASVPVRPAVSIMIRTQGKRKELITETLYSIYAQSCPAEKYEILISYQTPVPDPDKIADFEAFLAQFPPELVSRITVYPQVGNTAIQPYNFLLETAHGEYMFYLDDDDMLIDGALSAIVAGIEEYGSESPMLHTLAVRRMINVLDWRLVVESGQPETADEAGLKVNEVGFVDLFNDPDNLPRTYPYAATEIEIHWPYSDAHSYEPLRQNFENQMTMGTFVLPRKLVEQTLIRFDPAIRIFADWEFLMRVLPMFKVVTLHAYTICCNHRTNNSQLVMNSDLLGLWAEFYQKCLEIRAAKPLILEGKAIWENVERHRDLAQFQASSKKHEEDARYHIELVQERNTEIRQLQAIIDRLNDKIVQYHEETVQLRARADTYEEDAQYHRTLVQERDQLVVGLRQGLIEIVDELTHANLYQQQAAEYLKVATETAAYAQHLEQSLQALTNSLSWKISAPVRLLTDRFSN